MHGSSIAVPLGMMYTKKKVNERKVLSNEPPLPFVCHRPPALPRVKASDFNGLQGVTPPAPHSYLYVLLFTQLLTPSHTSFLQFLEQAL